MIVRNVDVRDLSNFDFFNDAFDTMRWLMRQGRVLESRKLMIAYGRWKHSESRRPKLYINQGTASDPQWLKLGTIKSITTSESKESHDP